VPVISKNRSAKVDLPWSIWAMMQKLRMLLIALFYRNNVVEARKKSALILSLRLQSFIAFSWNLL